MQAKSTLALMTAAAFTLAAAPTGAVARNLGGDCPGGWGIVHSIGTTEQAGLGTRASATASVNPNVNVVTVLIGELSPAGGTRRSRLPAATPCCLAVVGGDGLPANTKHPVAK